MINAVGSSVDGRSDSVPPAVEACSRDRLTQLARREMEAQKKTVCFDYTLTGLSTQEATHSTSLEANRGYVGTRGQETASKIELGEFRSKSEKYRQNGRTYKHAQDSSEKRSKTSESGTPVSLGL